jgi:hypothetical protein
VIPDIFKESLLFLTLQLGIIRKEWCVKRFGS